MIMSDHSGFESRIARIEALTATLERCQDLDARAASRELVGALLDLHGAGLAKVLELTTGAGEAGRAIVASLARDGLVANLLLLHGLHPENLESRIRSALDGLRSRIGNQAGVDLVGLEGDSLRLRLSRECGGCPSSTIAIKKTIEDALLAAAPDLSSIEFIEEAGPSTGLFFLPVITL
jgi:Fe-S cluster biogenesis protein NfuA